MSWASTLNLLSSGDDPSPSSNLDLGLGDELDMWTNVAFEYDAPMGAKLEEDHGKRNASGARSGLSSGTTRRVEEAFVDKAEAESSYYAFPAGEFMANNDSTIGSTSSSDPFDISPLSSAYPSTPISSTPIFPSLAFHSAVEETTGTPLTLDDIPVALTLAAPSGALGGMGASPFKVDMRKSEEQNKAAIEEDKRKRNTQASGESSIIRCPRQKGTSC